MSLCPPPPPTEKRRVCTDRGGGAEQNGGSERHNKNLNIFLQPKHYDFQKTSLIKVIAVILLVNLTWIWLLKNAY